MGDENSRNTVTGTFLFLFLQKNLTLFFFFSFFFFFVRAHAKNERPPDQDRARLSFVVLPLPLLFFFFFRPSCRLNVEKRRNDRFFFFPARLVDHIYFPFLFSPFLPGAVIWNASQTNADQYTDSSPLFLTTFPPPLFFPPSPSASTGAGDAEAGTFFPFFRSPPPCPSLFFFFLRSRLAPTPIGEIASSLPLSFSLRACLLSFFKVKGDLAHFFLFGGHRRVPSSSSPYAIGMFSSFSLFHCVVVPRAGAAPSFFFSRLFPFSRSRERKDRSTPLPSPFFPCTISLRHTMPFLFFSIANSPRLSSRTDSPFSFGRAALLSFSSSHGRAISGFVRFPSPFFFPTAWHGATSLPLPLMFVFADRKA